MYHNFLIHSSADGYLGCFHVLAKQCCNEHWGTYVSFNSGFLSVYAQKWDCWVVWQFSKKAMETHSSNLAWKIPWMEGPGRLQSMGSLGVEYD